MRYLPNIITIARIACLPLFVIVMMRQNFTLALYLILITSVSDALDGFLAKRFGWESKLGAYLDPLADKGLIITAFLLLQYLTILPLWFVVVAIGRDILIVIGCTILHFLYGETDFRPHWTGKISTFLQFILIIAALVIQIEILPATILPILINATVAATIISAIVYTTIGRNLLMNSNRQYNL